MPRKKRKKKGAGEPRSEAERARILPSSAKPRSEAERARILPSEPVVKKVPDKLARPFAEALKGVKVEASSTPAREKALPPSSPPPRETETDHSYDDRVAFRQAMDGVRQLGPAKKKPPAPRRVPAPAEIRASSEDAERAARARLAALVGGGVRFSVERDGDHVQGHRVGAKEHMIRDLREGRATPESTLDLHGRRTDEAERELIKFIRAERSTGVRLVCVVHGKGHHSEGGIGVLGGRVLHTLTEGGAAPFVEAFVTAAQRHGGTGALLVRLTD